MDAWKDVADTLLPLTMMEMHTRLLLYSSFTVFFVRAERQLHGHHYSSPSESLFIYCPPFSL
jgi:hypothetical protein